MMLNSFTEMVALEIRQDQLREARQAQQVEDVQRALRAERLQSPLMVLKVLALKLAVFWR
jgi:hypothetical protein